MKSGGCRQPIIIIFNWDRHSKRRVIWRFSPLLKLLLSRHLFEWKNLGHYFDISCLCLRFNIFHFVNKEQQKQTLLQPVWDPKCTKNSQLLNEHTIKATPDQPEIVPTLNKNKTTTEIKHRKVKLLVAGLQWQTQLTPSLMWAARNCHKVILKTPFGHCRRSSRTQPKSRVFSELF